MKTVAEMTEEYLNAGGKINYIGKKPKKDTYKTQDIITIHYYDETIKVL